MEDTNRLSWRKSSHSGNGGGNCVEVGGQALRVLVRDTRQAGSGPVLLHGRRVAPPDARAQRQVTRLPGVDGAGVHQPESGSPHAARRALPRPDPGSGVLPERAQARPPRRRGRRR